MKVEMIDLHGLNLTEAMTKVEKNIDWALNHGVNVLVLNHGKGHHSNRGFSVIKTEIRTMLKDNQTIKDAQYKVVYGESNLPVALTYNEGQTLIVEKGIEKEHLGDAAQQQKNQRIYSDDAKKERKSKKQMNAQKRNRSR